MRLFLMIIFTIISNIIYSQDKAEFIASYADISVFIPEKKEWIDVETFKNCNIKIEVYSDKMYVNTNPLSIYKMGAKVSKKTLEDGTVKLEYEAIDINTGDEVKIGFFENRQKDNLIIIINKPSSSTRKLSTTYTFFID